MFIQPISQNYISTKNYAFYNRQKTAKPGQSSFTRDYIYDKDTEIIKNLQEISTQNKTQSTILGVGVFALTIAGLFITYVIDRKGGGSGSSARGYGRNLSKAFESLKADKEIPTLDNCKSINSKLRKFLKEQASYAQKTPNDINQAGTPKAANKLLLYGPPGTGKSYFAKIYAKTLDAQYKEVKFSDFNSIWSGEHIENLRSVFEEILSEAKINNKKKLVVVLNEIDSVLQPAEQLMRAATGHSMFKLEERAVFINYIDEIAEKAPNVTIIGTTNISPKNKGLDGAAMSRFKNIIEVNYPEKDCIKEALKVQLLKIKNGKELVEANKDKLDMLSQKMVQRKCSFRDLNTIVENSKSSYLEEVSANKNAKFKFEYLEDALKNLDLTDGEINTVQQGVCL